MAVPSLLMSSMSRCTRMHEFYNARAFSVLHGRAQKCILLTFAETELPCHQLTTVFLDIKMKLTQKIFLNRAQWLNWQCYKYYGTKVYFCLYFSLPDTVKPTVNTQTFLLLLLSRRVCGFFRAILNSVPHFIQIFTQRKVSDRENLYTVIILLH